MAVSVLLAVGAVLIGPMATGAWAQEAQQDIPPETQGVAICGEAMPDGSGEIARASFTLTNGTDTDVAFGTQRDPRRLRLDFDVRGCQFRRDQVGTEIHVRDPLLLDADGHSFEGDVTATGRIRSPTKVRVVIDIDPDNNEADAGTFEDAVEILSGLGEPTVDPFTVTMQYSNPVLAFATVFLPVLLLGSLAVWAKSYLALSPDERTRTPWDQSYREWWIQPGNLVAVAAGLVAARLAFGESFLGDPDWGAESHGVPWLWPITSNEWWTLATVVLTAFTGAALAATLPADVVRERHRTDPSDTNESDGDRLRSPAPSPEAPAPKQPPGLAPAPEIASYADVVWYRKTWLLVLSLLIFPLVAIVVALTGDTYRKANRRMKAISPAEVWRYDDRGKWIMVAVAVALLLFGWVRVGLGI